MGKRPARKIGDYRFDDPEEAYGNARRVIVNNALRRRQKSLDLSGYGLTDLPPEIGELKKLESLNLRNNKLTGLSPEIGKLVSLNQLRLEFNELHTLPSEIGYLTALRSLDLTRNQLRALPPEIGNLIALHDLTVESNLLTALPAEIGRLKLLTFFMLEGNQIIALPPEIGELESLIYLDLDQNQLNLLPSEIGQLSSLESLHLRGNRLKKLPLEVAKLKKLETLVLRENQLADLPSEMGELRLLEAEKNSAFGLALQGNPLPHPYPILIQGDTRAVTKNVLAWLRGEIDVGTLPRLPSDLFEEEKAKDSIKPEEPALESGPTFSFGAGRLDLVPGPETNEAFDRATQIALHNRIIRRIGSLRAETLKVGNRHPGLALTVEEYASLISQRFEELDVTDLWAVGNGLLAHAISFEKQNENRTLTEPLEPSHFALLFDVARLHAGFILGFPKAVELTERADRAQLTPDIFDLIDGPTSNILSELSQNRKLVSDRARRLAEALQAAMTVAGWGTTRVGYTSYATVRNALIQLCKALVWTNDKGGSLAGSVVVSSAFVASGLSAETIQLVFQFLHFNASNMVAFAAPFPELRAWVGWIIDHLDEERIGPRPDDVSKSKA